MNAVAATPGTTTPRFIDNGDNTVTDTSSGLMWSKATLTEDEVDQAGAEAACTGLELGGHTDWRLPTVEELFALADRSRYNPAINTDAFPDTRSDWYWSSTSCAWSSVRAWVVLFSLGLSDGFHRGYDLAFVRAVRSVPAGQ